MTPTVANLKPAISLFLTNVSMPTQRRIKTCAIISKAVGRMRTRGIKSHKGKLDRKCDNLASPRFVRPRRPIARHRLTPFAQSAHATDILCCSVSRGRDDDGGCLRRGWEQG